MRMMILSAVLVLALAAAATAQDIPEIYSLDPGQNEVSVPASQDISIRFTTPMDASTLNGSTIIVYGGYTGYHDGSVSYNETRHTAIFDPAVDFAPGEVVTVSVTTGVASALGYHMDNNFAFTFIVGGTGGAGAFGAAQTETLTGSKPVDIRAADLDGDADIDLVTKRVTPDSYIMTTWSNDGTGDFTGSSHETDDELDMLYDPLPVDLDRDGDIEVLFEFLDWSNYQSVELAMVENPFGATIYPSYRAGALYETAGYAAADLDGDGDQDIVQSFYGSAAVHEIRALRNNGSGALTLVWSPTVTPTYTRACAADFDNDGWIDFASLDSDNDEIAVWINGGSMSFVLDGTYAAGADPDEIIAMDLDGDGDADLAAVNGDADNVSVLFNDGTGGFGGYVTWAVGDNPRYLAGADLDDDGDMDLVTANAGSRDVSVLLNNGIGDFGVPRVDYPSGDTNQPPGAVVAADLDGDGDIDLATSNGGYYSSDIKILPNKAQPLITARTPARNALNVAASANVTVTFDIAMNGSTFDASAFIVRAQSSGPHAGSISYNSGSRTATFNPASDFEAGEVVTVSLTPGIQSAEGAPIRACAWSFTIVADIALAEFPSDVEYPAGDLARSVFAADFTGDGIIDLAAANLGSDNVSICAGNGDGTFDPQTTWVVAEAPRKMFAADLDGDGDLDIATCSASGDNVSVLLNGGNGTFAAHVDYPASNSPYCISGGDLDGDGDVDLMTGNLTDFSVLENNGNGTFAAPVNYATGGAVSWICAFDSDFDGDLDVSLVKTNDDEIEHYINSGGALIYSTGYATGGRPYCIAAADLDGDGTIDMAVPNRDDGTVTIFPGNGNGFFYAYPVVYPTGTDPVEICASDLDGDGDIDLAVANYAIDAVSVLANNGGGAFTVHATSPGGDGPFSIFAADLDGEGSVDLVAANLVSDGVSVFLNDYYLSVSQPVTATGVDMPFISGSDTLAIVNFASETLDSLIIRAYPDRIPPNIPGGTDWVRRYYEITPYPPGAVFEADIELFYEQAEFDISGISDEATLHLYRYDDGEAAWQVQYGALDVARNSVSCPGVTEFSVWAFTGSSSIVGDDPGLVPDATALDQNYPNPFNPVTQIRYSLSRGAEVRLVIYDVLGREIVTLADGRQEAGLRTVTWNGRDAAGRQVASGVYFYRLLAGEFAQTRKMVLLR